MKPPEGAFTAPLQDHRLPGDSDGETKRKAKTEVNVDHEFTYLFRSGLSASAGKVERISGCKFRAPSVQGMRSAQTSSAKWKTKAGVRLARADLLSGLPEKHVCESL
jgi:hypothetical protein